MTREYNYTTYGWAPQLLVSGASCSNVSTQAMLERKFLVSRYRAAPNGVWPFYLPTFMAAEETQRSQSEQFAQWRGSSQEIGLVQGTTSGGVPNDFGLQVANSRDRARYKALERLYEKLTDIDISETAVQAKAVQKTVNIAESIADLTKKAVGRFGLTRVIANGWMWTNYGVKPLVNDMFAAVEHVSRQVSKPFTLKAGYTEHFVVTPNVNPLSTVKGTMTCRVQATLKAGAFDSLSSMTSMDPAYIAWTALPWTFISDYFYNIGGYLRQMELQALYNTAFLHGCQSEKITANGMLMSGKAHATGWSCYTPFMNYAQHSLNDNYYSRGVISSLPGPMPPQLDLDLKSNELLNIAAALGSFLTTGKQPRTKNFTS